MNPTRINRNRMGQNGNQNGINQNGIAALIALSLLLAGCGNKGPLLLPAKAVEPMPVEAPVDDVPAEEVPAVETPAAEAAPPADDGNG